MDNPAELADVLRSCAVDFGDQKIRCIGRCCERILQLVRDGARYEFRLGREFPQPALVLFKLLLDVPQLRIGLHHPVAS